MPTQTHFLYIYIYAISVPRIKPFSHAKDNVCVMLSSIEYGTGFFPLGSSRILHNSIAYHRQHLSQ
jgi:hypothetical protein